MSAPGIADRSESGWSKKETAFIRLRSCPETSAGSSSVSSVTDSEIAAKPPVLLKKIFIRKSLRLYADAHFSPSLLHCLLLKTPASVKLTRHFPSQAGRIIKIRLWSEPVPQSNVPNLPCLNPCMPAQTNSGLVKRPVRNP